MAMVMAVVSDESGPGGFRDLNASLGLTATATLGERVRKRRESLNLSRQKFAELAGVSVTQVQMVETGRTSSIQNHILRKYARVLQVSETWLRHGFGARPSEGEIPSFEEWLRARGEIREENLIEYVRNSYDMARRLQDRESSQRETE